MKPMKLILISAFTTVLSANVFGQPLNADEIIAKANLASYYAGDDGSAEARMLIVDSNGQKQMRQFNILRKDVEDQGNQDMMVFFSRPSDVAGTVFRVVKKVSGDDDRWLYLPALDLVKRISAGDKRTSFVGSHFYYEDVSGRNPAEDSFTLIAEQETQQHYVVKGTPKQPGTVEFSYYIAEIDKVSFLPLQVTYYDKQNNKMRSMQVLEVKNIQGIPTVMHSKIIQFSDNSYTEMKFRDVKYDVGLPSEVFSERSLKTPPKAWLN